MNDSIVVNTMRMNISLHYNAMESTKLAMYYILNIELENLQIILKNEESVILKELGNSINLRKLRESTNNIFDFKNSPDVSNNNIFDNSIYTTSRFFIDLNV